MIFQRSKFPLILHYVFKHSTMQISVFHSEYQSLKTVQNCTKHKNFPIKFITQEIKFSLSMFSLNFTLLKNIYQLIIILNLFPQLTLRMLFDTQRFKFKSSICTILHKINSQSVTNHLFFRNLCLLFVSLSLIIVHKSLLKNTRISLVSIIINSMKFVSEHEIKNVKALLEAQYCAKLSRTTIPNNSLEETVIKLFCKLNHHTSLKCPFLVEFTQYGNGFLMKETNLHHLLQCTFNNEETFFAKNKLVLESYRFDIVKIMRSKPNSKPREILDELIDNLGLDPNFLTQGLKGDKHFERRMKKKFDNTILELRNQMNIICQKEKSKKKTIKYNSSKFSISSKQKLSKKSSLDDLVSPLKNRSQIFSNNQQPIQIVNNINYFISNSPLVELINDQDRGTMRIHLINKSRQRTLSCMDISQFDRQEFEFKTTKENIKPTFDCEDGFSFHF